MSQNTKGVKGFFIGLLAGGAIGSIVAMLTTPKSGKNLRKEIKQKSNEYFDEAEKYLAETKHNAGKLIDESRKKFEAILHNIKSKPEAMYKEAERAFSDAKGKSIEVINSGKEKVGTETERFKSSVKAGIETYNEEKVK